MIIIDAHLDLSWSALAFNRDLTLPVAEIRRSEHDLPGKARGRGAVSFPEMREGQIAVSLATLLARAKPQGSVAMLDFRNQELACATAQGQLAYYRILRDQGAVRLLGDWPSLRAHVEEWRAPGSEAPLGFILAMEGADPILSPEQVPWWWENGLRVVGPTHYGPSPYGHGTGSEGGLTVRGRELLRAMEQAGIVLDVTHLAEAAFWEAMEIFGGTVLASHNNCRALVPGDRQFSDEQIRCLVERDAVIGTALDAWMLAPGWVRDAPENPRVTLDAVADQIDHVCQLAGNPRHAAIGSDLDGGFGTEQCPEDLDTIVDLQKVPELLRRRGYDEASLEAIFHGNWLRLFERAWTTAR